MPTSTEAIYECLLRLPQRRSLDAVLELFDALGYGYADELPLPTWNWPDGIQQIIRRDAEPPIYLAQHRDFYIIYTHLTTDHLSRTVERPVVEQTLHKLNAYALFVFANRDLTEWDLVNSKYAVEETEAGVDRRRTIRRIHVGPGERLHTAAQRVAMLAVPEAETSALELQTLHDQAFDVEEVTRRFYQDYKAIFGALSDDIATRNPRRAAEAETEAQMLLDRLMFLYFIQKKGWLDAQDDYLYRRFQAYHTANPRGVTFYDDFLFPLFLALSTEGMALPKLGQVPFLNGGLFEVPSDAPAAGQLVVGNDVLACVFDDLLERYNFTVREDTPLDVEVAIDPEMLGQVFENLVLGLEQGEDRRKSTGSYYTPRVIVHFMCRQALAAYLAAESEIAQERIEALMDVGPAEQLTPEDLSGLRGMVGEPEARLLHNLIGGARMLDPAVGSGAFVVGMLYEMVALTKLLDVRLQGQARVQRRNYDYDLKRRFIEHNLYGVDIQPEAVRICELRLWLSLMVDYERRPGEDVPPLPNLSYRVRVGDSLVERLFGEPVQLDALADDAMARQLIDRIRAEKEAYFQEPDLAEKERRELRILEWLCELTARLIGAKRGTLMLRRSAEVPALFADQEELLTKQQLEVKREIDADLARYEALMERVKGVYDQVHAIQAGEAPAEMRSVEALREQLGLSFIWRLDFAEVFAEKGGFDMVVANPPYVRADTQEDRFIKERQDILDSDVYETLWEKWDLYIPFIERGYKLLKPEGVLQFITSDAYCHAKYAQKSQTWFLRNARVVRLDFVSDLKIFEAGVRNFLFTYKQVVSPTHKPLRVKHKEEFVRTTLLPTLPQQEADYRIFRPDGLQEGPETDVKTVPLEHICYISVGAVVHADEKGHKGEFVLEDLVQNQPDKRHPRKFVEGKGLNRWLVDQVRYIEWGTRRAPAHFRRPTFPELHEGIEKLVALRISGGDVKVAYDDQGIFFNHTSILFVPWHLLRDVRNRSIAKSAKYRDQAKKATGPTREDLEELSQHFHSKYLLAVMNSSWARTWLLGHRRSNTDLYPNDWKPLPVPVATSEDQAIIVNKAETLFAVIEQGNKSIAQRLDLEIDQMIQSLYDGKSIMKSLD